MKIKLNAKDYECSCGSVYKLRKELFDEKDLIIINGFQVSDDCAIREDDELFIIPAGKMPDKADLSEMMCARHTPHVHEAVKKATVGIAGLGGLGSNIAAALARTGVGRLVLVDFDVVEPSNLNRQSYYVSDLGLYKTDALRQQLSRINPYIDIITYNERVDGGNAADLFRGCDIVCEAFDNAQAKAMLVNTLYEKMPGIKIVSGSGMAGLESSNKIRTVRRMKNLYICGDETNEARQGCGLMAPRVLICAGHQANMILRLLTGIEDV
ncbi:MAG: sulfur carrier protein ThiS adenylyltransferase ThiF [Oscillospiraceae bacterium]|nr:sulfur carrier protein ThiS adenylyltransferase ThiF [Oscillospiraceae bacterium]